MGSRARRLRNERRIRRDRDAARAPSPREGRGLTFSCTFSNDGDEWIVFDTGEDGEMFAIMSSYAYPKDRPHEVPPSLGTIIFRDGGTAELVETTDIDGPY